LRKFKKFAQSRWHSIPLGAMAIALVAALLVTGTVFAAMSLISNTWVSPTATVYEKPRLQITSTLGTTNFDIEVGVQKEFQIEIYNPSTFTYTGIQTTTSIYRTDGTNIAIGDVELWHKLPEVYGGTWQQLSLTLVGTSLVITTNTADIVGGGTDITPLRVTFKTAGKYQASAISEK
jgi:hypothetical protein